MVVTNHAMLAIDALESFPVLPEHDVVVSTRVTSWSTG